MSLLISRNKIKQQYAGPGSHTFYPLGLHPAYGDYTSPQPPKHLQAQVDIIRAHMRDENGGLDILQAGDFQAYVNMRPGTHNYGSATPITKAFATAALCLPPDTIQFMGVQRMHNKLISAMVS